MSRRKIELDPEEIQAQELRRDMSVEAQLAAIWSALDEIEASGTDIGGKARVALERVRRIKRRVRKKRNPEE